MDGRLQGTQFTTTHGSAVLEAGKGDSSGEPSIRWPAVSGEIVQEGPAELPGVEFLALRPHKGQRQG